MVFETRYEFEIPEASVILQVIDEDAYYVTCSGIFPHPFQIEGANRGAGGISLFGKVVFSPQNQGSQVTTVQCGDV